jgi:hypothetical protein
MRILGIVVLLGLVAAGAIVVAAGLVSRSVRKNVDGVR